jgi:hypothetical protein
MRKTLNEDDVLKEIDRWIGYLDEDMITRIKIGIKKLPSEQPEEVIPHRNYKYFSDYWCECGWHLGKKGEVKYCADCGRKVNWEE